MEQEEDARARFKKELINKLLHLSFKDDKTRVNNDALLLMCEMLRSFVREAAARAVRQAETEQVPTVDIDHLEKVLPQLLLDF
ncbi:centromere protein X isoform X2 [Ambystoma mexicanum]|uniref:centromere protein X isoform X2 n=1 Tax=Ambystoma mexicanum TaxID=8296 RepID=UPI0037E9ACBC